MKTLRCSFGVGSLLVEFLLLGGPAALAQTSTNNYILPVVTVSATQPVATATNPGVFTFYRAGDTNPALNVWYDLGGTASNGVDYAMISPHLVAIDAGMTSSTIAITPLGTMPPNTVRTVVVQLTNSPLMTPVNYGIGSPSRAVVYLEGPGVTNLPPWVYQFEPKNGAVFYTPTNIFLAAKAGDPDGSVTNVEFWAGTNDLGPGLMVVLDPPGMDGITGPIWIFNWQNVPVGNYALAAVATDNDGAATTSDAVNIAVLRGPPPTNLPPVVRMVSPVNGEIFRAPVDIPLFAFASDPDGSVASVQFFAGTNSLGFGQPLPLPVPLAGMTSTSGVPPIYPTNLFLLTWSNAPPGFYALTAQATDDGGALATSAPPVNIAVLPPLPPPTNRPPLVSIVASDPVAIEGTNCWVWLGETNAWTTWTNANYSASAWAAWPTAVCRFFTNCGPKTALFTVRRWGDTNSDLTVSYDIGGTASNGVDYVALPGYVTIPAGERRALIPIVPIDDGPPDVNKSVVLALEASTNVPPDYLLGFPQRAAAIIIDSNGPQPVSGMLSDDCFHLVTPGPDAAWFCIEYSTNLLTWTSVCTNQVVAGSINFVDPDARGDHARFYRVVPLSGPPAE